MKPPSQLESPSLTVQILSVSRCDRWQVCQRLQALQVPCHCHPDGSLAVEINTPLALVHLRSVVHQLTASRADLLDWLECCWQLAPPN